MRLPFLNRKQPVESAPVVFAPLQAKNPELLERKGFNFVRGTDWVTGGTMVYRNASLRDRENNSVVMACCAWAGRNIMNAEVGVWTEKKDGWELVPKHPASVVVRNPQGMIQPELRTKYTGRQLLSSIIISVMLTGDAYVQKLRNAQGRVIGLDYIPEHQVNPKTRAEDSRLVEYYEVNRTQGVERIPPTDMITFPLMGLDEDRPWRGVDRLKAAAHQIITDNKIAEYSGAIMDSPSPRLAISPTDAMMYPNEEQAALLQEAVKEATSGKKAGRAIIPTFPANITPFSFSPDQMAIETINRLPETRICAIMGIPPTVLQLITGLEHSTYSNMKEAREAATEEFLLPMWNAIADVLNMELMGEYGSLGDEIRFDTSKVRSLMEDEDAKHKRAREDFAANLLNRAEAREKVGEDALPGDENVWAYTLRPAPMMALPQGAAEGNARRGAAEA